MATPLPVVPDIMMPGNRRIRDHRSLTPAQSTMLQDLLIDTLRFVHQPAMMCRMPTLEHLMADAMEQRGLTDHWSLLQLDLLPNTEIVKDYVPLLFGVVDNQGDIEAAWEWYAIEELSTIAGTTQLRGRPFPGFDETVYDTEAKRAEMHFDLLEEFIGGFSWSSGPAYRFLEAENWHYLDPLRGERADVEMAAYDAELITRKLQTSPLVVVEVPAPAAEAPTRTLQVFTQP